MTSDPTPSRRITDVAGDWPGVQTGLGSRGEFSFKLGAREIGHLHGDRAAHFFFPKDVWDDLRAQNRIEPHPVFPDKRGPAARRIDTDEDVRDVIELFRLNYERAVADREQRAARTDPAAA